MNDVHSRRLRAALAIGALAGLSTAVWAQSETTGQSWQYVVGAGAVTQPQYPGANHPKTRVVPLASASFGRFAIGNLDDAGLPVGAAVTLLQGSGWKVGGALGTDLEDPRKASDSPRLKGTGDIRSTLLGSLYATYDQPWFRVHADVLTDLDSRRNGLRELDDPESRRSNGQGTRASIDLEGKYSPTRELTLVAGPGLVWADSRYQRTFFGVDAAQAANSGLAVHDTTAGLDALRFTLGAQYRVTPAWQVGASVVASDLQGDAATSPITEKRWQNAAALTTAYRF